MKKILLVITGLMITLNTSAQTWSWAAALGGRSSSDGTVGLDRDANGNIFVSGDFEGTRTFGSVSLTAAGLADGYFSKYNSSGVSQWTVQISGSGSNILEAAGLAVDGAGNIYVAGNFSFNVILGSNVYTNTGGNYDGFIAKYDPTGTLLWSQHLAGNGSERITTIKTLGTDVYVAGGYSQAFTYGAISFAAPAGGFDDAFLLKMDSQGVGSWGLKGGGSNDDRALALSVSNNAIYWAGYCNSVAAFGGVNVNPVGTGADIYISKLNSSGAQAWVKRYGGNFGQQINGVSQDPWGNPICTGNFYATASFGPGFVITEAYAMAPAGNGDAFVAKLNGVDGTCAWVRQIKCINGDNNEVSYGASTDPGGSTYITGSFNATTSFASTPPIAPTTLAATNGKDAFLAKYSQTGTLLWVQKIGGTANDLGKSVIFNLNGICTVAGNFGSTITLGTAPAITASPGASSVFVATYSGLSAGINTELNQTAFEAYPNPANDFIHVSIDAKTPIDQIEIYSITGTKVFEERFNNPQSEIKINTVDFSSGLYFLQITAGEKVGTKKIQIK